MISLVSSEPHAGKVPVSAMTLAPSSDTHQLIKSAAASALGESTLMARAVTVPRVEPAGALAGWGYLTMPQLNGVSASAM